MTSEQFTEALAKIGFTQKLLADTLQINERTVRRFASGASEVPTTVAMLLNLMIKTKTEPGKLKA